MIRQKKSRDNKKKVIDELIDQDPSIATKLKIRKESHRPRIEDDQPSLLKAIIDIATHGSATDGRRSSDVYRTVRSLDDLTSELNKVKYTYNYYDGVSYINDLFYRMDSTLNEVQYICV